jgi:nucleoside-diphosphate-sugar epimerase
MKVFLTGASGHVGTVVVSELLDAGHTVIGLARSDRSADLLVKAGAQVYRGSLDDMESLTAGAQYADGVIHLAFKHDLLFSGNMVGAAEADMKALSAIAKALEGTNKPLVGVNGTLTYGAANPGRTIAETDILSSGPRIDSENFIIGLAAKNVRSSVVRLAPTVHGPLDNEIGFIPTLIRIARDKGFSGYIAEGLNRWPAVHELDAARLFRLAMESAPAGSRLHAVHERGIAFKHIAEAIGNRLNLPAKGLSLDEAKKHFGHMAYFVSVDNPTSSQITRELLNWEPAHTGLIDDLKKEHYFTAR